MGCHKSAWPVNCIDAPCAAEGRVICRRELCGCTAFTPGTVAPCHRRLIGRLATENRSGGYADPGERHCVPTHSASRAFRPGGRPPRMGQPIRQPATGASVPGPGPEGSTRRDLLHHDSANRLPGTRRGVRRAVRSYLEVLAEHLPPAAAPHRGEVVVHDSCVYARAENVIEAPRQLLAAGLTVSEPVSTGGLPGAAVAAPSRSTLAGRRRRREVLYGPTAGCWLRRTRS